jgi:hypothetical protein
MVSCWMKTMNLELDAFDPAMLFDRMNLTLHLNSRRRLMIGRAVRAARPLPSPPPPVYDLATGDYAACPADDTLPPVVP